MSNVDKEANSKIAGYPVFIKTYFVPMLSVTSVLDTFGNTETNSGKRHATRAGGCLLSIMENGFT